MKKKLIFIALSLTLLTGCSKSSDVLLPYSTEVNNLNFDIELIEFISRKVLITSSRPLNV